MQPIEVQPELFPPPAWFAVIPSGATAVFDLNAPWDKRHKQTHRYTIADVNGTVDLTTPVSKPESFTHALLAHIKISTHGEWWHKQRIALESAYGRTPFFEFYFPKLLQFFSPDTPQKYPFLWQYLLETTRMLAEMLQLDCHITTAAGSKGLHKAGMPVASSAPYWQIRSRQLGFIPDLSALDLLFNMGPEAALYMRNMSQSQ